MQSRRSICSKRSDRRWWCSISSCRRVTATSWSSAWPARARCRAPCSSTARETTPGPASPPPCAPPRGTGSCRATVCSPTSSGTARRRPRRVRRRCTRCRSGVEQPGVRPRTGLKWAAIPSDKAGEGRGGSGLPAGGGAGRWLAGRSGGRSVERAPRPQGRSAPAGPRPIVDPAVTRLAEQLGEIAAGAAAPEDMLEPALAAVLEASHASAGALCLFDQRNELLRLAAEVGLSDEGCKRLRQVRRGGTAGWDMPLHGLLNRRVYLIESAARNRYVPPLVDAATSVRAVACVPLYAGTTPVASLVLVAIAPERITEEQLAPLSEPLRDLAHMIEAARRRGATAAPAGTPPAPVRPAAERDRREAARVQSPVTSVAAAEAREAAAEPVGNETREAEEVERLMARLAEAEAAAERERERLRASEGEREQLAAQLREAATREERAGDEIARLMADTGTFLAEREQLAEARAREDEARARHADLEMRVEGLRAEREAEVVAVSARLESIAAERDRLSAALAEVQAERDCLAAEATRHVAGEARPPQSGLAPADIVVVDDEPAWAAAAA